MSAVMEHRAARQIYLHPGQMFVTADPAVVTTILGSCIAVCLWDPVARVAGMNHYLLPKNPLRGTDDARYGDSAMDALLTAVWNNGAEIDRLVAKVFGGACVLKAAADRPSIGEQNAAVALAFLERHRIEVIGSQIGGERGRKD